MLSAQSLGLGPTIIGLVHPAINKTKALKTFFNIPIDNEVVSALIVGYPKFKYPKAIIRKKQKINYLV